MKLVWMSLGEVAAVVATHLKTYGTEVVVVGGSAITSHVPDVYTSMDVDFAVTSGIDRRRSVPLPTMAAFPSAVPEFGHPTQRRVGQRIAAEILHDRQAEDCMVAGPNMSDMSDLYSAPPKASRHVAEWILRYIARKGVQPGDRLPSEHNLVRATRVGRSSVREAFQLLAGRGLLEARPGKGYFLRRAEKRAGGSAAALGIEEIQDLTEARIVIEGACAALAALRATSADVARIEAFLSTMEAKAASAPSVYRDALKLHLMIAEAAHNHTLSEMLRVIIPKIAVHGAKIAAEIPDHAAVDAALHRELWAKIRTGDPEVARTTMEMHIRDAASLYRLPYESRMLQEGARFRQQPASPPSSKPTRFRKG